MDNLDFDAFAYNAFLVAGFLLFILALALMVARTAVRECRDFRDWLRDDSRARATARRVARR